MAKGIKIFIIECVDPMDLLQGRSEATALEQVCRSIGNEVAVLTAYSEDDFEKYCNYISSIDSSHDNEDCSEPLCVHISTHGNNQGIAFGKDFVQWHDLFNLMESIFTRMNKYHGDVYISVSACDAGYQKLVDEIEFEWDVNSRLTPPEYVFVTGEKGGVRWDDALVAWTLLYHRISKLRRIGKFRVQKILNDIKVAVNTELEYFRWDSSKMKYLRYRGK
ncbi:hypothetical protein [Aeromonas sp. HMWF015]|uniref:hypothetical protein n=1 Tax=Aeromonas sp. HMWF015 TaxID=2056851 RepID=UPI000D38B763|nr:hypothetical protein [Aeromonas sp. HMWF015]PTT56082.1 hypothetical protein DBR13_06215 [Aeromonas sp. HMWF015]